MDDVPIKVTEGITTTDGVIELLEKHGGADCLRVAVKLRAVRALVTLGNTSASAAEFQAAIDSGETPNAFPS